MSDKFEQFVSVEDGGRVWRDIDSAPTDGTEIILRKGERVTAGSYQHWSETEDHYDDSGCLIGRETIDCGASWCSYDGGFCDDDLPTHWMPMPEPPSND